MLKFHCIFFIQKPILLHGHERAITQIKYNREGDLIFTAAKDNQPNVWYSLNGERLGSFKGHNGAVWCIDVNCILLIYDFNFTLIFVVNSFDLS
jgi:WD40 repeat protein